MSEVECEDEEEQHNIDKEVPICSSCQHASFASFLQPLLKVFAGVFLLNMHHFLGSPDARWLCGHFALAQGSPGPECGHRTRATRGS